MLNQKRKFINQKLSVAIKFITITILECSEATKVLRIREYNFD